MLQESLQRATRLAIGFDVYSNGWRHVMSEDAWAEGLLQNGEARFSPRVRLIEGIEEMMEIPNYREWEGKAEVYADPSTFGSVLGTILVWKEKRIGVLWIDAEEGRKFNQLEKELLTRLAAIASIAFEQSRLRERDLYKVERLQLLSDATNDIVRHLSSDDREKRLSLIAEYAHKIINAEACGILLVESEGWLTWMANHGHGPEGFEKGRKFEIRTGTGTGLTGHIAYTGEVFIACGDELIQHPAVRQAHPRSLPECHSLLVIPLKNQEGDLKGLLRISNKLGKDKRPHAWTCFTDDDVAIAKIFAQAAFVEMETADLLDEIRKGEKQFRILLEAFNIIAQAKVPESGLTELAEMILQHLDKSFCRILLKDENEEELHVIAAAKRGCQEKQFEWNPRIGETTTIREWGELDRTLTSGEPTLLH